MSELGYIAKEADRVNTAFTRSAMDLFAQSYNKEKDNYFAAAHGIANSDDYHKEDYQRVAFHSSSDAARFVQDMKQQGIEVAAAPFKLNGQYVAEIAVQQNDGRQSADIIEDFKNRYDIEPQEEKQQAFEQKPANNHFGEGLADTLVINHLDTLGVAIHKVHEISQNVFGEGQYGQTSNQDIFRSGLNADGEANPVLNSGHAKVATVLNNNVVVMDGEVVTDEAIRNNVLKQHEERMEHADKAIQKASEYVEKSHIHSVAQYINQQAEIVEQFESKIEKNYTLSKSQQEKYDRAKEVLEGFEQDFGRAITPSEPLTTQELSQFNQDILAKAKDAGILDTSRIGGEYLSDSWKKADSSALSEMGVSDSTKSLLYSLNANDRHISNIESNAEALREAMYRQEYAVTTSKGEPYTVKEEPSVFAAWTLGSLDDITKQFNTEQISRETLINHKLADLDTTDKALLDAALQHKNEEIEYAVIKDTVQKMPEDVQKSIEDSIQSGAISSYRDLLNDDVVTSFAASQYKIDREAIVNTALAGNKELENSLAKAGIDTSALVSRADGIDKKLDQLIQNTNNPADKAALSEMQKKLAESSSKEIQFQQDFSAKIKAEMEGKNITYDSLLSLPNSENSPAEELLLKHFENKHFYENGIIDKEALEAVRTATKEAGISSLTLNKDNEVTGNLAKTLSDAKKEQLISGRKTTIDEFLKANNIDLKTLRSMSNEDIQKMMSKTIEWKEYKLKGSNSFEGANYFRTQRELSDLNKLKSDFAKYSEEAYKQAINEQFAIKDKEKALAEKAKATFTLSKAEQAMLTGTSNTLAAFKNAEWLKGKGLLEGAMTPEKLLMINAEFLRNASKVGYNFITATGKFDIKLLQSLNKKQLKDLGLTPEMRKILVQINEKGSFGKTNQFGNIMNLAGRGLGFFIRKVDGSDGFNDISELVSYTSKGIRYTKNTITSIRRLRNIRLKDLSNLRHRGGVKALINKYNQPLPPKKPRAAKKPAQPKKLTTRQIKKQEKYAEKLKKKLTKTYKKQNTMWAKLNKQMAAFKKKLAESAIGHAFTAVTTAISSFVTTALLVYFGVAAILALFVQVVMLIASLVIALVDTITGLFNMGNWFAPSTYSETVAYQLYTDLTNRETQFVMELANTPDQAYQNRNTIKYGFDGEDLNTYLSHFNNLVYVTDNGGDVKINPFWRDNYVTATENSDYMTDIDKYDGTHTFDISTNLNYFSIIDANVEDEDAINPDAKVVYGVSNGHTSNTKDIIAMTDVMYQMEATDSDDGSMTSVLGMSPAQLNSKSIGDYISHGFKVIGEFFVNLWDTLFGGGSDWEFSEMETNGVFYRTIQNYAFHLFEVSHQQYLYLNVEYCNKDKVLYNASGSEISLEEGTEVEHGICSNPVTNKFKVKLDRYDKPEPYVEKTYEDGSSDIKFLNETDSKGNPFFDITVSYEDNYVINQADKICLWDDMPTESDTYKGIPFCTTDDTVWNRIVSNGCWQKVTGECSKTTEYLTADCWGAWRQSQSSAQSSAKAAVLKSLQNQLAYKNKEKSYYIIEEDQAIAYIYTYETSISNVAYTYEDYDYDHDIDGSWYCYEYSGKAKWYTLEKVVYTRNCKGHDFEYCGGHVTTHEQGNVFSVTNEQLAMTDMYDEEMTPIALSTKFFNDGMGQVGNEPYSRNLLSDSDAARKYPYDQNYNDIQGKVIHSEINYSTPAQAATTGGGLTPLQDIYQGTAVSHGLNIIVDENGNWGRGDVLSNTEGFDYSKPEGENGYHSELTTGLSVNGGLVPYCRDIFDIDCIILKGCNIFPYKDLKKYEGWTADNMTLVANRVAMDWYEAYGFDIATEIGQHNYKLSIQDIEMLQVGLEAEYGENYTTNRQEIINSLLSFVGMGHYTMHQHPFEYSTRFDSESLSNANHGFLSYICSSTNTFEYSRPIYDENGNMTSSVIETTSGFSASCSAGNEIDIGNYAMNYIAKKYNRNTGGCYDEISASNPSHLYYPGDVITHNEYDPDDNDWKLDVNLTGTINGELLKDFHLKNQAVVYVGTFSEASINAMKQYLAEKIRDDEWEYYVDDTNPNTIKLSTGQSISANLPICIDLNQMGMYSGLRLRTEGSTTESLSTYLNRYFTGGVSKDDVNKANPALSVTYYWLIHPDNRTFKYDAEDFINPSW